MENINVESGYSSLEPLLNKNNEFLFKINNTKQLVMMDLFWIFFFFLFVCTLWLLFVNLEQNIGRTWEDLFLQEIYSPRFSSILVILFVVGPISTYFAVKKTLLKDNNLYFYDKKIIYHNKIFNLDEIIEIKIGFNPINGTFYSYLIAYILAGWFLIPLRLFEIFWFNILKLRNQNNVQRYSNHYLVILGNQEKPIASIIYNEKNLQNLQNYILKKGINNGRK